MDCKHIDNVSKGALKIKSRSQLDQLYNTPGTSFKAQKARSCTTGS